MKKVLFGGFGLIMLACFSLGASSDTARRALAETLYGAIYYTEHRGEADYVVSVTEFNNQDLNVWESDMLGLADQPGVWYIASSPGSANYRVYITEFENADLRIRYVPSIGQAGPTN